MKHYHYILAAVAALCLSVGFTSCGEESLPPDGVIGNMSYSIGVDGADGDGTSASPALVKQGDTLSMAISQTCSYTDPDGSVFTCKPEAVVRLSTSEDTLFVKDFKALTTVKESSKVDSKTTEGEKLTKKTKQTFSVGGKEVVFDLAYDIYSHVNSLKRSIELPYIKVNAAKYGTAQTEETRAASVSLSGIRITPHVPVTRGSIIDSTKYDVNVSFNLDIESVNTKEPQSQTLSFEVSFLAVLETTTSYPDPEMQFDYQLQVLGGTTSTASPFTLSLDKPFSLSWQETARYNYFDVEKRVSKFLLFEPKASVKVSADSAKDTIWVTNKQGFEQYSSTEAEITTDGTSPLVTTGQKTFTVAGKKITIDWSHETFADTNIAGTEVAIPHLELGEPQFMGVTVRELSSIPGKQAKVCEVTVRISQEVKTVNPPKDQKQTVEHVEYVVKYIGAFEVKLVKVVYRKDWEWVDSHDNMMLAYYPMVHRDRIYSTGETFTDTFRDAGHVAGGGMQFTIGGKPVQEVSDGILVRTEWPYDYRDSILIAYYSASVPNLSKVFDVYEYEGDIPKAEYITSPPGTWDEYQVGKTYKNLDISLDGIEVVGADSVSTKPSGWYVYRPDCLYMSFVCIYNDEFRLLQGSMHISFYDQFLVIDGQMINFLEYRGPMNFSYHKDYITMPNGAPGFIYTTEFRRKFLEKDFYFCRIDSIYQQQP